MSDVTAKHTTPAGVNARVASSCELPLSIQLYALPYEHRPPGEPLYQQINNIKSEKQKQHEMNVTLHNIYPMIHNGWSKLQYSEFFTLHHASRHLWVCSETRL